jgi:proteasome beta subunit
MTLILALDCADGLILASDGQATIGTTGQPLKGPIDKIFCPWQNVAWGSSGHVGVAQHVAHVLGESCPTPDAFMNDTAWDIRRKLVQVVLTALTTYLPGYPTPDLQTGFLFVARGTDRRCILEIPASLVHEDHIDRGYSAIGSGDIFPYFALAGLSHFKVRAYTLHGAKLVAYRVMDDAINVAAQWIGPPIQMIELADPQTPGSPVETRKLSDDDIKILRDKVAEWKEVESETLAQVVGLPAEDVQGEPEQGLSSE